MTETNILGAKVHNATMQEAVDSIIAMLDDGGQHHVAFVNAFCANVAFEDPAYREVLAAADRVFADGVGVAIAGHILGHPFADNVNGTDLFPRLLAAIEGTGRRLFLLGAAPGVAEDAARWVRSAYPGVEVAGVRHGYFGEDQDAEVAACVARARTDLLLVGFGVPKQELWIRRNLVATRARVAIGVGGLFDFYSGRIPRAPEWLRRARLEWAFRLAQEPRRLWRRYVLGNPVFLLRVAMQRLTARPCPLTAPPPPRPPPARTPGGHPASGPRPRSRRSRAAPA